MNKIEKNIPIPNWHRRGKWIEVLLNMKKGDSILLEAPNDSNAIRLRARKMGVKLSIRKTKDGLRAWRVSS